MLIGKFEGPFVVLSVQLYKFFGALALFVSSGIYTKIFDVGWTIGEPFFLIILCHVFAFSLFQSFSFCIFFEIRCW